MMSQGFTLSELATQMQGRQTLDGWHLLASYAEADLNKVLAEQSRVLGAEQSPIAPFDTVYDDPFGRRVRTHYELVLGAPRLTFMGQQEQLRVSFPVSGTYTALNSTVQPVPAGLVLECTSWLMDVTGGVDAGPGLVLAFDKHQQSKKNIVLTMPCPVVQVVDALGHVPTTANAFCAPLATYLQNQGLAVRLLTAPGEGLLPPARGHLRPSHLAITSVVAAGSVTILLWMAVQGLPFEGVWDNSNRRLVFNEKQAAGQRIAPVPRGASASVILSEQLVYTLFMQKVLEKYYFTDITLAEPDSERPNIGLAVNANFPLKTIKVPPSKHVSWDKDVRFGGDEIQLKETAVSLQFSKSELSSHVSFKKQLTVIYNNIISPWVLLTQGGLPVYCVMELFAVREPSSCWSVHGGTILDLQFVIFDKWNRVNYDIFIDEANEITRKALENWVKHISGIKSMVKCDLKLGGLNLGPAISVLVPGKSRFELLHPADNLLIPRDLIVSMKFNNPS